MDNMEKNEKNESFELDVMVENSNDKKENLKRTRAIPQGVRSVSNNRTSVQSSVNKSDTVVNNPVVKPVKKENEAKSDTIVNGVPVKPVNPPDTVKNVKQTGTDSVAQKNKKTKNTDEKGGGLFSGIAKALIYIIAVISISGVLSYYGIIYSNDIFAFVKDDVSAEISIKENTTVSELADLLHSGGIIEHPGVFRFYTWYRHRNDEKPIELSEGTYEVSSLLNYDMLLSKFRKTSGGRTIVTLTFKEGLTVDETIKIFTDAGVGNRENFIEAINNYEYDYKFVKELEGWENIPGRKYRLEGYLYPDTYDFYTDSQESFIISKLLSNFNQKFEEEYYDRCAILGYTVDEMITLASIIEKEGFLQEDLDKISSVFHNRLSNWDNPYLQSDATIQYSFEERKKEITSDDLKIDSLYNTYMYKGLPPSAVANPGLESILAALYPAETNYYYFVTYKNGAAIFSRTLGEHNNATASIKNASAD
ncbi:MAG: endolytic transglycosylase MltG [Clostridia bacterium]|nr:endolytic transglycosylase MltG [Clostridia bacterium]